MCNIRDPTAGCATCHADIVALHQTSLHKTLNGMSHALELRGADITAPGMDIVWAEDCASCHTTCADCHVALPAAVGGGLIKGHEFLRRFASAAAFVGRALITELVRQRRECI